MERYTKENGYVVKFLLFPSIFILSFFIVVLYDYFAVPGLIGLTIALISLVFYYLPDYQDELLGIRKETILKSVLLAGGVSLIFWALHSINPALAIGFPNLHLSISRDIRWFLVVIIFPILEEIFFRSVMMGGLMEVYKISEFKANIIQSFAFMLFHLGAYGIALGAYDKWVEAFGAFRAISGLFVGVFFMGMVWGYISRRDGIRNILFNIISHSIINAILFTASIVVI